MVNSNPETVSTDYDTSDILFFEPLTIEDVLNICDATNPDGVIVQFGGQTPLNLARGLQEAGVPIIGTSVDTIEAAEDRERFQALIDKLKLRQPPSGIARNMEEARREVERIGYPALVRPSFVLGGRAMEICYDKSQFERYVAEAFIVADGQPVLIDHFLEEAIEVDVDAVSDGKDVVVMGIMEHIEEAGVHSGDSACAIPPFSIPPDVIDELREAATKLADALNVVGLMNIQFAIKTEDGKPVVYILEVNPRASRTVPFVAKATGCPVASVATKVMAGMTLAEIGVTSEPIPKHVSIKESVFPFRKFAGVDIVLGPEMKSTGEVMGISDKFSLAFAKSQIAAGVTLPTEGKIFISLSSRHKESAVSLGRDLTGLGFELLATSGTASRLESEGVQVTRVRKLAEGHPNLIDYLKNEDVVLIMNTPSGKGASDGRRKDSGRRCSTWCPLYHHRCRGRSGCSGDAGTPPRRAQRSVAAKHRYARSSFRNMSESQSYVARSHRPESPPTMLPRSGCWWSTTRRLMLRAMTESLEKVGYKCTVATSGPEAAKLIERDTFDIIITDMVMNDVDGMKIAQGMAGDRSAGQPRS